MPASLGTHELHFSQRKTAESNRIVCGCELDAISLESAEDRALNFISKGIRTLLGGRNFSTDPATPAGKTQNDEDSMDEKQFGALMGGIDALNGKVAEFGSRLDKLEELTAAPGTAGQDGEQDTPVQEHAKADAASKADQFSTIEKGLESLSTQFAALTARMEQAVPGTAFNDTTAPAGDSPEVF
jgi:hypothetical protein